MVRGMSRGFSWHRYILPGMVLAFCLLPGCLHTDTVSPAKDANTSIEMASFMGVSGGESFFVFGKAVNTGESAVEKVVLVIDFKDKDGNIVDSRAISSPGKIAVNGTWDFEVSLDGPSAQEVRFYNITVLY